jgi:hypothetical protein
MKKKPDATQDPEMRDEYDFSGGVRGKYAQAYAEGSNVVVLDPEVAEEFPDSESVNQALRSLLPIIKDHTHAHAH